MIIDGDCHISSHKADSLAMVVGELVEQMDREGVDKAIAWLRPPYDRGIEPENRAVFRAMVAHPNRIIGFGWVNPRLGSESAYLTTASALRSLDFTVSSSMARRTTT